jgi:uncharacterized phage-associated protein
LADRLALDRWGFNITTDRYVAMDQGPVVSNIYDLITQDAEQKSFWVRYISPPLGEWEVQLKSEDLPENKLSKADEKLLQEIFGIYGTWNRWQLRDFTHDLPEWQNPHGSSIPIQISDILKAQGASDEDINDVIIDLSAAESANDLLGSRT